MFLSSLSFIGRTSFLFLGNFGAAMFGVAVVRGSQTDLAFICSAGSASGLRWSLSQDESVWASSCVGYIWY